MTDIDLEISLRYDISRALGEEGDSGERIECIISSNMISVVYGSVATIQRNQARE